MIYLQSTLSLSLSEIFALLANLLWWLEEWGESEDDTADDDDDDTWWDDDEWCGVRTGGNCIKIGLPGKSILRNYFQENRTFPETFYLTENQLSGKIYFYTIRPWCRGGGRRRPMWSLCRSRPWGGWRGWPEDGLISVNSCDDLHCGASTQSTCYVLFRKFRLSIGQ